MNRPAEHPVDHVTMRFVVRNNGFDTEQTISLTGLPAQIPSP